ncbi:hypothetical protein GTQ40_13065 [Flavobacteriaceae bacterium R38]|nr:hypothetical protein [Flavobacteriaceae bacterium R38]
MLINRLLLLFFLPLFSLISCTNDSQKNNVEIEAKDTVQITIQMPAIVNLNPKVFPEIAAWNTFKELEAEIEKLYDFKENEDFSFIIDELIKKEKALSSKVFPEKFNTPSVKSRVLVLKTYILQTKAAIDDKEDEEVIMKQKEKIIVAYNALLKQFNERLEENLADEFLNKN